MREDFARISFKLQLPGPNMNEMPFLRCKLWTTVQKSPCEGQIKKNQGESENVLLKSLRTDQYLAQKPIQSHTIDGIKCAVDLFVFYIVQFIQTKRHQIHFIFELFEEFEKIFLCVTHPGVFVEPWKSLAICLHIFSLLPASKVQFIWPQYFFVINYSFVFYLFMLFICCT